MVASLISRTLPAQPDCLDLTKKVREVICVTICMGWESVGMDSMVQALHRASFPFDQVQVYWIMPGDLCAGGLE